MRVFATFRFGGGKKDCEEVEDIGAGSWLKEQLLYHEE